MIRKLALALVAAVVLGAAAIPTDASAQQRDRASYSGRHHGGGHGGWNRGARSGWQHNGHRHGWIGGRHHGWYGGGWRYGGWYGGWRARPYAYVPAPYYGGCYRHVRVGTPWGPRWRRVWVCG